MSCASALVIVRGVSGAANAKVVPLARSRSAVPWSASPLTAAAGVVWYAPAIRCTLPVSVTTAMSAERGSSSLGCCTAPALFTRPGFCSVAAGCGVASLVYVRESPRKLPVARRCAPVIAAKALVVPPSELIAVTTPVLSSTTRSSPSPTCPLKATAFMSSTLPPSATVVPSTYRPVAGS